MSKPIVCDVCGDDINRYSGRKWMRFKRKFRHRLYKFSYGGLKRRVRFDICNRCWHQVLETVREKTDE